MGHDSQPLRSLATAPSAGSPAPGQASRPPGWSAELGAAVYGRIGLVNGGGCRVLGGGWSRMMANDSCLIDRGWLVSG